MGLGRDGGPRGRGRAPPMMSGSRWRALCQGSLPEARASLMADPWPRALSEGEWPVSWGLHPGMSSLSEWPASLLTGRARFANGYSATVVYGCGRQGMEDWTAVESGPWPFALGAAARCGDEARGGMLACFDPRREEPVLCEGVARFDEAHPETDVGARTAMVEARDERGAAEALRLVASLPSSWDDPAQDSLWRLAREGAPGELWEALAGRPEWAWRPWSQGSRLLALAARLGRWGAAAEIVSRCDPQRLGEAAQDCAAALADFCADWAPLLTARAAPKALLRAWSAGVPIDAPTFVGRLGLGGGVDGIGRAWAAWALAERAWLLHGGGRAAPDGGARRL